jgi:hypothetical protein
VPFELVEEDELDFDDPDDWGAEPLALVDAEEPVVGGAALARDTTLLHCAAAFAFVSVKLKGKYDTSPLLSS